MIKSYIKIKSDESISTTGVFDGDNSSLITLDETGYLDEDKVITDLQDIEPKYIANKNCRGSNDLGSLTKNLLGNSTIRTDCNWSDAKENENISHLN